MRITEAKFVASFADVKSYLAKTGGAGVPEFCFVGRSNVGKSTLINMLTSRRDLARTSSTPGRTRLINLFELNGGQFRFTDLPGYGFALASKTEKAAWDGLMDGYLRGSKSLIHAFVLLDIRREPSDLDIRMTKYFYVYGIPFTAVATKCDKISRAQADRSVRLISSALSLGKDDIILTDRSGTGRDKLLERIDCVLSSRE